MEFQGAQAMEMGEELFNARVGYKRDCDPASDLAADPKRLNTGKTVYEVGMDTSSSSSSVKGNSKLAYSTCHHLMRRQHMLHNNLINRSTKRCSHGRFWQGNNNRNT
jgi:hypothetical protein